MPYPDGMNWQAFDAAQGRDEDDFAEPERHHHPEVACAEIAMDWANSTGAFRAAYRAEFREKLAEWRARQQRERAAWQVIVARYRRVAA